MSEQESGAPRTGRRIDRVLGEGYLTAIATIPLAELRQLRSDAEQEEVDVSYVRRLIQGRLDIVRAELNRREGPGHGSLVEGLARILADEPRAPSRGLGRHAVIEPSRADAHRRYVESLVAHVDLSDLGVRSSDELHHALRVLSEEEQVLSAKRRAVQEVMDACSAEVTRRYRDGEATVATLLGAQTPGQ